MSALTAGSTSGHGAHRASSATTTGALADSSDAVWDWEEHRDARELGLTVRDESAMTDEHTQ